MKERFIVILVLVAILSSLVGFLVGWRVMEDTEAKFIALFSEDVKEVRQGKLAGAAVAMSGNETLSEAWEEVCSDIIRYTTNEEGVAND